MGFMRGHAEVTAPPHLLLRYIVVKNPTICTWHQPAFTRQTARPQTNIGENVVGGFC